jgi:hypothetical protein
MKFYYRNQSVNVLSISLILTLVKVPSQASTTEHIQLIIEQMFFLGRFLNNVSFLWQLNVSCHPMFHLRLFLIGLCV